MFVGTALKETCCEVGANVCSRETWSDPGSEGQSLAERQDCCEGHGLF